MGVMRYKRFEDLPVGKDAVDLAEEIDGLLKGPLAKRRNHCDQLERATLSISNNIAEGFDRQTTRELLQFIYYAKGSAAEVMSMCHVMRHLALADVPSGEVDGVESAADGVARQLGAWAVSQRDAGIEGHRYLGQKDRRRREESERQEAFMDKLRQAQQERLRQLQESRPQPTREEANDGGDGELAP